MEKDLEHLKILSICYYVSAGITALFSCIPFIHLSIGIAFLSGAIPDPPHRAGESDFPMKLFGLFFTVIPAIIILSGFALAIATFLTGKYLKQQKNYIFCLIIAGLNCLFFPVGTTLGVFTFIVLFRDSVKNLFTGKATVNATNFN